MRAHVRVFVCVHACVRVRNISWHSGLLRKQLTLLSVHRMWDNPYHNFFHVFDVMQTVYSLGISTGLIETLSHWERFALIVAALCHDLEHPGVNNMLLIHKVDVDTQFRCVLLAFVPA